MKLTTSIGIAATLTLGLVIPAGAASQSSFALRVLVDGSPCPEYGYRGTSYVEALRGRDYTLRITNPLGRRVAVALAVDGLNTIDARHSDASSASKWVIEPYGTIEITGWQVSGQEARRFVFSGERDSYGAWLGDTANLGVIEAVVFQERVHRQPVSRWMPWLDKDDKGEGGAAGSAPSPQREASRNKSAEGLSDDSAATGIGDAIDNPVQAIHLDLETSPVARLRIRYEFRSELIRMGVIRQGREWPPWDRREEAQGFAWCPDPDRR
jgi:hypothetical protein